MELGYWAAYLDLNKILKVLDLHLDVDPYRSYIQLQDMSPNKNGCPILPAI